MAVSSYGFFVELYHALLFTQPLAMGLCVLQFIAGKLPASIKPCNDLTRDSATKPRPAGCSLLLSPRATTARPNVSPCDLRSAS